MHYVGRLTLVAIVFDIAILADAQNVNIKVVTHNVMSAQSFERLEDIVFALKANNVDVYGAQGTRRKLFDVQRGFDVIVMNGFLIISFGVFVAKKGHNKFSELSAGVALFFNLEIFSENDVQKIWVPKNKNAWGRLGAVRMKRYEFDFMPFVMYVPPLSPKTVPLGQ